MNKLLNRSLLIFSTYALFVLAASIPAYHYLVDTIWLKELDEHNLIIAQRTEKQLNAMHLGDSTLKESITLWNSIQPATNLTPHISTTRFKDSLFTELRQNPYLTRIEIDRFRGLKKIIKVNGKPFLLKVETNVEETEETVAALAFVTLIFFIVLVAGFLLLNRIMSKNLWKPFRLTLKNLQEFNLNHQQPIQFPETSTYEFKALNLALEKLIAHTISVYKGQKEFTENASHELQTPLAVIKGQLNLLMQNDPLTKRQYELIEGIEHTLNRVTRINRNLLLLTKIENQQFNTLQEINLTEILIKTVNETDHYRIIKWLSNHDQTSAQVKILADKTLVEILAGNLISNAVRHRSNEQEITIMLSDKYFTISNSGNQPLKADKIFNRFSSSNPQGSGLGLSIVREVCVLLNWSISYRYSNGKHSFTILFS